MNQGKLLPEGVGIPSENEGPGMNNVDSYLFYLQEKDGAEVMTVYEEASYPIGYYELNFTEADLGDLVNPQSPIWQ